MSNALEVVVADMGAEHIAAAVISRNAAVFDATAAENLLEVIRTREPDMYVGDVRVSSISWLGSGGAKTVHDIKVLGKHYALSLPNGIQDVPTIMEKWPTVLDEAANTDRIRALGFFTNSVSKLVQLTVNGVPFPALLMKRYRDMPFEVRDNKNPVSSVGCRRILPPNVPVEKMVEILQPLADDIRNLVMHGVHVQRDSLNICIADGQPRLYFNDLGTATFEPIPDDEQMTVMRFYVDAAVSTVINGIIEEEYDEYHAYFDAHHVDLADALYAVATALPMSHANPTNAAAR